jgi:hypothetical protein
MEQQLSNVSGIHLMDVEPLKDDKYIVLKRSEVEQMVLELGLQSIDDPNHPLEWALDALESYALNDAVVIRTGDTFAGPALHSYAHTIALVANMSPDARVRHQLQRIADYFADRAREADVQAYEETAKLPD